MGSSKKVAQTAKHWLFFCFGMKIRRLNYKVLPNKVEALISNWLHWFHNFMGLSEEKKNFLWTKSRYQIYRCSFITVYLHQQSILEQNFIL